MSNSDKVEISPTSCSECSLCGLRIKKGEWRVGIRQKGNCNFIWYHKRCLTMGTPTLRQRMVILKFNPSGTCRRTLSTVSGQRGLIEREVARVKEEMTRKRQNLILSRTILKNMLKDSRAELAQRHGKHPLFVFTDSILDTLVEIMPSNEDELLKIRGVGKQKVSQYGSIIISTILRYKLTCKAKIPLSAAAQMHHNSTNNDPRSQEVIVLLSSDDECEEPFVRVFHQPKKDKHKCDGEDDNDDANEVIIEKELSVDELVTKRIRDAEEKGDVIVL